MNEQTLQIVIQSGAIGTNLVMLYVFLKVAMLFNRSMADQADRCNKAQEEESKAKVELAKSLTKLAEKIEHCPNNRVPHKLAA